MLSLLCVLVFGVCCFVFLNNKRQQHRFTLILKTLYDHGCTEQRRYYVSSAALAVWSGLCEGDVLVVVEDAIKTGHIKLGLQGVGYTLTNHGLKVAAGNV